MHDKGTSANLKQLLQKRHHQELKLMSNSSKFTRDSRKGVTQDSALLEITSQNQTDKTNRLMIHITYPSNHSGAQLMLAGQENVMN